MANATGPSTTSATAFPATSLLEELTRGQFLATFSSAAEHLAPLRFFVGPPAPEAAAQMGGRIRSLSTADRALRYKRRDRGSSRAATSAESLPGTSRFAVFQVRA